MDDRRGAFLQWPGGSVFAGGAARTVWSPAEAGIHLARRGDRRVGHVVATATGSFVAFDHVATPIGYYATLRAAKRSAAAFERQLDITRLTRWRRRAFVAASAAGAAAFAVILTAGVMSRFW